MARIKTIGTERAMLAKHLNYEFKLKLTHEVRPLREMDLKEKEKRDKLLKFQRFAHKCKLSRARREVESNPELKELPAVKPWEVSMLQLYWILFEDSFALH
jgi:hypothetical protein